MNKLLNDEINRCYGCKTKPCQSECPLGNDITGVITLMKDEKYKEAFELLSNTTVLSSICSRVCPHFKQCESFCTAKFKEKEIDIGAIESFLGDLAVVNEWDYSKFSDELEGKKVAVVGSGPAGLTAAAFLARYGACVTILEKRDLLGGILRYGIPEFRLEKDVLNKAIEKILKLGIDVKINYEFSIDSIKSDDNLLEKYDVIFLSFGANVSKKMKILGVELNGVFGGNELLEYGNHPDYMGRKVFVLGGGNVAMDSARTIKRLGAEKVIVVYRRAENEMSAEKKEITEAKSEGIDFLFHTNLSEIIGEKEVERIRCIETAYDDGKLENVEGTEFFMDADFVVMAIGSSTNLELLNSLNLEVNDKGYVNINDNYQTSNKRFFAGGDLVGEKSTVAWAARSGRNAAESIRSFLLCL